MRVCFGEDLTTYLTAWNRGDKAGRDALLPLVYDELRDLAARYLRDERAAHTLEPTAIVHEILLRLAAQNCPSGRAASISSESRTRCGRC